MAGVTDRDFRLIVRRVEVKPAARITRMSAMLPVLSYLSFLIFFLFEGYPSETRSIAFFAMGVPVIAAVAGFQRWAGDNTNVETRKGNPVS